MCCDKLDIDVFLLFMVLYYSTLFLTMRDFCVVSIWGWFLLCWRIGLTKSLMASRCDFSGVHDRRELLVLDTCEFSRFVVIMKSCFSLETSFFVFIHFFNTSSIWFRAFRARLFVFGAIFRILSLKLFSVEVSIGPLKIGL